MFISKGSTVNHVISNKYLQFYIYCYTLFYMCYTVIYQSICIIVFLFLGFAEIYIIMFMNVSLHIKSSFAEHVPLLKLIIMRALINSPNKCYCSQSDIARCCFTLYYLNVFLCSYHVYVCSSH